MKPTTASHYEVILMQRLPRNDVAHTRDFSKDESCAIITDRTHIAKTEETVVSVFCMDGDVRYQQVLQGPTRRKSGYGPRLHNPVRSQCSDHTSASHQSRQGQQDKRKRKWSAGGSGTFVHITVDSTKCDYQLNEESATSSDLPMRQW